MEAGLTWAIVLVRMLISLMNCDGLGEQNLKRPMRWVFRELLGTEDLYQLYINNMRICLRKVNLPHCIFQLLLLMITRLVRA